MISSRPHSTKKLLNLLNNINHFKRFLQRKIHGGNCIIEMQRNHQNGSEVSL